MGWIADFLKQIPLPAVLKDKLGKAGAEPERTKWDSRETPKEFGGRDQLEDTEVKILVSLARKGGRFTAELVAIHLQTDLTRTEYFLSRLTGAGYISAEPSPTAPTSYQLARRGNEYLVDNNLA